MNRASEMREIAGRLLRLADDEDRAEAPQQPRGEPNIDLSEGGALAPSLRAGTSDSVYLYRLAEALVRLRRLRDRHFDADLFADPAWDMLLDLFIQRAKGRRVDVTSICNASQVPETTALRWLGIIQKRGWISRETDSRDRRRVFVGLSRSGEVAVTEYLTAAARYVRLTQPVPFMLVERVNS